MVDAPERIWAYHNGNSQTYLTVPNKFHNTEYTRSDLVAELEAEVERLKGLVADREGLIDTLDSTLKDYRAEALSRTGAVKVKKLEWEALPSKGRYIAIAPLVGRYVADSHPGSGTPGWKAPGVDEEWQLTETLDEAKAAAQADYERRIISALEPAAPEGQQCRCDKCNAVIELDVHVPDEIWKRISPKPIDGYKGGGLLCPQCIVDALTRPSEQAVIEAMVDKVLDAAGNYMSHRYGDITLNHPTARARIKAAMEAGR